MSRRCNKCKIEKALDCFHNDKNRALGKVFECKPCVIARSSAWAKTDRGKKKANAAKKKYLQTEHGRSKRREFCRRPHVIEKSNKRRKIYRSSVAGKCRLFDKWLNNNYGIGVEDWARMYNAQKGKCPTCDRTLVIDRSTHVDHDHVTGKVRELLCANCNRALGCVSDNETTLRKLALYVEKHRC